MTVQPAAPGALWVGGAPLDAPTVIATADRVFALGPEPDAVRFAVLVRGDRRRVRTYDPAFAGRRDVERDVAWYPVEPAWVVPARLDPAGDGETVPIVTLQGDVRDTPAAGRLHVRVHGEEHALLATCPLPPLENRLPFVVRAGERTPSRNRRSEPAPEAPTPRSPRPA